MRRATALIASLLLALPLGIVLLAPVATAVVPVQDCTVTILPSSITGATIVNLRDNGAVGNDGGRPGYANAVFADGTIALMLQEGRTGGNDGEIRKYDPTCASLWPDRSSRSTGSFRSLFTAPAADPAGQFSTVSFLTDAANPNPATIAATYLHLNPDRANAIAGGAGGYSVVGSTAPVSQVTAADGYLLNGGVRYLYADGGASKVYDYSDAKVERTFTSLLVKSMITDSTQTPPLAYFRSGAFTTGAENYLKWDLNAGAQLATVAGDTAMNGGDLSRPLHGQGSQAASLYFVRGGTTNGGTTNTLAYDKVNIGTWAKTVSNQAITGMGAFSNPTVTDADIDGNNNFLICGSYSSPTPLAFVAMVDTTTNAVTMTQDVTPAASTSIQSPGYVSCKFDFKGGFYVQTTHAISGGSAVSLSHWTGGGFVTPTYRPVTQVYTNPSGTGGTGTGGTTPAPVLDCSATYPPDATYPARSPNGLYGNDGARPGFMNAVVTSDGSLLTSFQLARTGGTDGQLLRFLPDTCSEVYAQIPGGRTTTSTGAVRSVYTVPATDPAGQFSVLSYVTDTGSPDPTSQSVQFLHLNPERANLVNTPSGTVQPYSVLANSPALTHLPAAGGYLLNGAVRYVYGDNGNSRLYDYDDTHYVRTISGISPRTITTDSTGATPYAYIRTGGWPSGAENYVKLDLSAGTVSATLAGDTSLKGGDYSPLLLGQGAQAGKVYAVRGGTTNGGTTNALAYDVIDAATWTKTTVNQAIAGFGALSNVVVTDADIDGNNNLLVCGTYSSPTPLAFIAFIDTTTNAVNRTKDVTPSASTSIQTVQVSCAFDFHGGYWVESVHAVSNNGFGTGPAVTVAHFHGGSAKAPSAPPTTPVYPQPAGIPGCGTSCVTGGPVTGTVDAAGGLKGWGQSVGFVSGGSLFLFGFILMLCVTVIVGGVTKAVASDIVALVATAVAAVGMMIVNALAGIWDVVWAIVLIAITAGVASYLVRKLFQPGGETTGA